MADDWVEQTVHDLERWAGEQAGAVDVAGARMLLELARQDLMLDGPGELTADALNRLLLDVFPEAVVAGPEDVPAVLDAWRSITDALAGSGRIPAEQAGLLHEELRRVEPEFAELLSGADAAERSAAADLLLHMMTDDGVDTRDEAAVERWVQAFEALPEQERFSRTAEYLRDSDLEADLDDAEMAMPAVRLAPAGELAAVARVSPLFAEVAELAAWTGERPVTDEGEPGEEDAAAAVAALGLGSGDEDEGADEGADPPEPTAEQLGLLGDLWHAALAAEVLTVGDGFVRPGPAVDRLGARLDETDDETVLNLWLKMFEPAVTPRREPDERSDGIELARWCLPGLLVRLYEDDGPVHRAELAVAIIEGLGEAAAGADLGLLQTVLEAAIAVVLARLQRWRVVDETGDGYRLTPLGVWAMRETLTAQGFVAPAVGDLADASADELIDGLALYGDDTAEEEIDGWLAGRAGADAAADLLTVMASDGPGGRNLAAAVLHRLGSEAEPAVRTALDDPLVRPYAALWLRGHGDESVQLSPDETTWIFIDTVAGLLETLEPGEAVTVALADTPPGADLRAMMEHMWRADHPFTAEVLDALGAHHPEKAVAKAARKAAFKARSQRDAQRGRDQR